MHHNISEYDTECVTQCELLYSFSFRRGAGFDFFFRQILSRQVKKTLFEGETGHLLNELIFLRSKLTPPSFDDPMTAAQIKKQNNILNSNWEGAKTSLMWRFANPQEICKFLRGP